jgi:hypothetical protein
MYRRDEVIAALFGRIGFKQPIQPGYVDILNEENTTSKSGRHFEGFHAMVTIPNIKEVCNGDVTITDEQFNDYLKDLQEDCILSVLDGIFDQPEVIEQRMEFERGDQRPVLIPNVGRFVGREINIAADPSKSVRINAVTLTFNGDKTFNLYLFDGAKRTAIKTLEVTTVTDNQVVVTPEDWTLNYMSNASKSSIYYVGYFQDDLDDVQAYDERPYTWNCGNCYGVRQIEANVVPTQTYFLRYNPFITNRTHGLNIEFSSLVDFTEVIIRSPQVFDKAIGLQMAAMVVERVVHGQRSNSTQRIAEVSAQRLYNDLNLDMATPEMPYSSGLKNQLRRELKRLHDNFFPKAKAISTTITDNSCFIPRHNPWG